MLRINKDETTIKEDYEYELRKKVFNNFKIDYNCFLDIGANVGLWTYHHGKLFNEIHCFEPVDFNYKLLKVNTNNIPNVKTYFFALGEFEETRNIMIPKTRKNFGLPSFNCKGPKGSHHLVPTKIKTLDSLNLKPSFIKIDVEGFELFVLRGGKNTIKKFKPSMVVESNKIYQYQEISNFILKELKYRKVTNIDNLNYFYEM